MTGQQEYREKVYQGQKDTVWPVYCHILPHLDIGELDLQYYFFYPLNGTSWRLLSIEMLNGRAEE